MGRLRGDPGPAEQRQERHSPATGEGTGSLDSATWTHGPRPSHAVGSEHSSSRTPIPDPNPQLSEIQQTTVSSRTRETGQEEWPWQQWGDSESRCCAEEMAHVCARDSQGNAGARGRGREGLVKIATPASPHTVHRLIQCPRGRGAGSTPAPPLQMSSQEACPGHSPGKWHFLCHLSLKSMLLATTHRFSRPKYQVCEAASSSYC